MLFQFTILLALATPTRVCTTSPTRSAYSSSNAQSRHGSIVRLHVAPQSESEHTGGILGTKSCRERFEALIEKDHHGIDEPLLLAGDNATARSTSKSEEGDDFRPDTIILSAIAV